MKTTTVEVSRPASRIAARSAFTKRSPAATVCPSVTLTSNGLPSRLIYQVLGEPNPSPLSDTKPRACLVENIKTLPA